MASRPSTIRRRRSSCSGSTLAPRSTAAYSFAFGTSTWPCVKRWPNVWPPERTPSISSSIVCSSSFAQSHRTGREKRRPPASQIIDLEKARPRTTSARRSGSASTRGRPGRTTPRKPSRSSRSSTATPCLRANPSAARCRRCSGGPCSHSSGSRSGRSVTTSAMRRGPMSTLPCPPPSADSQRSPSWRSASRHAEAGSSSQPISSSRLGNGLQVELRDAPGEVADAADVRGTLSHRDGTAGVEQVEGVRALQHLVVGGERQPALEQVPALLLVLPEAPHEHLHGCLLEVVDGPLALALAVALRPGHAGRPLHLEGAPLVLQEHGQPLETVGDLCRNQVELEPAELLEVRELGDLHPVHPDLPAEPPGTEGRPLPVVLHEPDVVLSEVDSDRLERGEVAL